MRSHHACRFYRDEGFMYDALYIAESHFDMSLIVVSKESCSVASDSMTMLSIMRLGTELISVDYRLYTSKHPVII